MRNISSPAIFAGDQSEVLNLCIALAKTKATIHIGKFSKTLNTAFTAVHAVNIGKHPLEWLFQIH